MAVRVNCASKSRRVLIPQSVHPHYAAVTKAITASQSIELVQIPYDPNSGQTDLAALRSHAGTDITAVIIPQPNVFGVLEQVEEFADWAEDQGALGIALVDLNPLGLLRPPGAWGR